MQNTVKPVLNEILVDVFHQILAIQQKWLKKLGVPLSLSEVHVLEAIEKTEEPSMSQIARRLHITVGSLTTAIKKLVKKGYVHRHQDTHDKRKVLLETTNEAKTILQKHDTFHQSMIEAVVKDIDPLSMTVLMDSFQKLTSFFKDFN